MTPPFLFCSLTHRVDTPVSVPAPISFTSFLFRFSQHLSQQALITIPKYFCTLAMNKHKIITRYLPPIETESRKLCTAPYAASYVDFDWRWLVWLCQCRARFSVLLLRHPAGVAHDITSNPSKNTKTVFRFNAIRPLPTCSLSAADAADVGIQIRTDPWPQSYTCDQTQLSIGTYLQQSSPSSSLQQQQPQRQRRRQWMKPFSFCFRWVEKKRTERGTTKKEPIWIQKESQTHP